MTQKKQVSGLDKFFGVTAAGSSIKVEIMAGLTTFFAMAYIIFVNPNILNQFYVITGDTAADGRVRKGALRAGLRHGLERLLCLYGHAGQRL